MILKQKNKLGVTLVELLIVTAVASILFGALITTLYQTLRVQGVIENTVSINTRATTFQGQLSRDLAGMFVPILTDTTSTTTQGAVGATSAITSDTTKSTSVPTANTAEKKEDQQQDNTKLLLFYAGNAGEMLETLSFVTNNSMAANISNAIGKSMPTVVRVIYRLVKDSIRSDVYTLYRREMSDINAPFTTNEQAKRAVDEYELIGGVAHMSATYGFVTSAQESRSSDKKDGATDQQDQKKIVKTVPVWQESKEHTLPLLPHFIKITLKLWDKNYRKKETRLLYIELPAVVDVESKKKPQPSRGTNPQAALPANQNSGTVSTPGQPSTPNVTKLAQNRRPKFMQENNTRRRAQRAV